MITWNEFNDDIAMDTSYFRMLWQHLNMVYVKKTFWCVHGRIDVCDVGTWLENRNFGGGALCEEGVTKEVSTGTGGRIILMGKSQREKNMWWHRL